MSDYFKLLHNRHENGWSQMCIWAAMLGDSEFCHINVSNNFRSKNQAYFFDAYFGYNFDWTPDQDHGCSSSVAAIFMLLQSFDYEICLLHALPEGWKVKFRLPSSRGVQEYSD